MALRTSGILRALQQSYSYLLHYRVHQAALNACIETDGYGGCCIQRKVDRREPRNIPIV
jgi:hypothetical protein